MTKTKIIRVELDAELLTVDEADLIDLPDAAKLVRGRGGKSVNVEVMRRYANPKRGRVFNIAGRYHRLVLPTVARGCSRLTTAPWVELWKRKYQELADLARDDEPTSKPVTPRQARLDHERAVERLRKKGFKVGGV